LGETHLTIIKGAVNGNAVDVLIRDRGHLCFLDRRDSTVGVEDEDGDVLFASETVNGGAREAESV
jgi:hypothetical protein